jgi:cell division protein ZipA
MRSELRWALLLLGIVFIAALAWWERRRPRQARGGTTPERTPEHEPAAESAPSARERLSLPEIRTGHPPVVPDLLLGGAARDRPAVPVLAPPATSTPAEAAAAAAEMVAATDSARAADGGDDLPDSGAGDGPAGADDASEALAAAALAAARSGTLPTGLPLDSLPRLPAAPAPVVDWPPDAQRRILALRLVASQPERFAGRSLRQALAAEGFVLGRFAIFHKPDEQQRAVLSAASLTRPGTFDVDTMDSQHYGGLSLFAVLPGPKSPPQAFDELIVTARSLNDRLCGVLQDDQGSPLTPARIALLRERLGVGAPA